MTHHGLRQDATAVQAFNKAERLRTSSQDSGRPLAASSRPSYDGSEASSQTSEGTSADGQECAPSSRATSIRLPFAPKRRSVQVTVPRSLSAPLPGHRLQTRLTTICTARIPHRKVAALTRQQASDHSGCPVKCHACPTPIEEPEKLWRCAGSLEADAGVADGARGRTLLSASPELEGVGQCPCCNRLPVLELLTLVTMSRMLSLLSSVCCLL